MTDMDAVDVWCAQLGTTRQEAERVLKAAARKHEVKTCTHANVAVGYGLRPYCQFCNKELP